MGEKTKTTPTSGYSKDGDQIFELADAEDLPEGFFTHPAMVRGSAAEKKYRADAAREGAKVPWDRR